MTKDWMKTKAAAPGEGTLLRLLFPAYPAQSLAIRHVEAEKRHHPYPQREFP